LVAFKGFGPGFAPPATGGASRNDKYIVNTNAVFLGDEMSIGKKLKLTVGLRYDAINMDMYGYYRDTVVTGSNPLKYVTMNRKENYADWTASIGGNYLVNARTAVYGNFTRAYRMPDYGAFTPLKKAQVDPTNPAYTKTIAQNEIVYNSELGYRSGFGDFNFDVSAFYTFIDHRLATVYEGAIATLKPLGNNDIRGAEIALTYAPQAVRGLNLSTSLTVQNAIFQEFLIPVRAAILSANKDSVFGLNLINQQTDNSKRSVYAIDLKGKQLPRVPSQIFNASASYDSKYWGFDASVNANMNMYNDATNLYRADDITWINIGGYVKYPLPHNQSMRLSLSVKNLLNTDRAERNIYGTSDDSALNQKQLVAYKGLDTTKVYYNGIPVMPRRILLTLDYKF
jgi:outer membrane receptor for Fe3+-dicitrate